MYCLILEFYEGLAEHILVELSTRATDFLQNHIDDFRKDIAMLKTAAGLCYEVSTIYVMLE